MSRRRPRPPEPLSEQRELAAAWLRYSAAERKERDGYFWAYERLDDLIFRDPETAWPIIDLIWRDAPNDRMLANIAAGPVEDLLARHGKAFIDRVYLLARREPVFRKLLGAVWRNSIAEPVWQKLKSIAGPEF